MKIQPIFNSLRVVALVAVLTAAVGARATTAQATVTGSVSSGAAGAFQFVAFGDSAEAKMLRDAYAILATGDHDYKGHRVRAMHAVERGAKLLGMDVAGDLKDRTPQALSDEKLRQAQGLLTQVLGSAEVKNQKRVVKNLNEALNQISTALSVR
jgi:hypothetical protein